MNDMKDERKTEYEKCVICGKMTDIPRDLDIRLRKTYMPGCGQLCENCCLDLYGTDDIRYMVGLDQY